MNLYFRIEISAIKRPILVALRRWFGGNLLAAKEIKIILSIPKIISRKVNVSRATNASGVVKISNVMQCCLVL